MRRGTGRDISRGTTHVTGVGIRRFKSENEGVFSEIERCLP